MTKFEPKFPCHFYQQGASHALPCIPSTSGADGWSRITTSILSLPSFAFQEGFIGNLICSHWLGPVPALNEKWPISRFISPSKFMGNAWQFSNQDQKAQHRLNPQAKGNPVTQPSAAALAPLQGKQALLVFSICCRNPSAHTREEHTLCWSSGCLIMRNFSSYGRAQAEVSSAWQAKLFSNFQPGRRGVSLESII